jgi:hypothetical protein
MLHLVFATESRHKGLVTKTSTMLSSRNDWPGCLHLENRRQENETRRRKRKILKLRSNKDSNTGDRKQSMSIPSILHPTAAKASSCNA